MTVLVAGTPRGSPAPPTPPLAARSRRCPFPCADKCGDPLVVVGRRAGQGTIDRHPAQEEMKVVLERDADAPVHLRAVLHELGAVLADVGLGRADQLGGVGGAP